MVTRDTNWPAGTPCWADCTVQPDHRGMHHARNFYGKLFGWHLEDGREEFGGYTMALKDDLPAAALMPAMADDVSSTWTVYFATDDIAAGVAAVQMAGGSVAAEPVEVPGSGRAAYCLDREGASFGLWEGGPHHGFGITGEPGSFGWASLWCGDVAAATSFYGSVFGFTWQEAPGGLLLARTTDGAVVADLQPYDGRLVQAATWNLHFAVADRDSSAGIAEGLDGQILTTAQSAVGPSAWLQSPSGESFSVVAPDGSLVTAYSGTVASAP